MLKFEMSTSFRASPGYAPVDDLEKRVELEKPAIASDVDRLCRGLINLKSRIIFVCGAETQLSQIAGNLQACVCLKYNLQPCSSIKFIKAY